MNREQWKERLPLIQAFVEGKEIQLKICHQWMRITESPDFTNRLEEYRIKPEPKLRPWKPEEVPVGAVVKCENDRWLITACWNNKPFLNGSCDHTDEKSPTLQTLARAEYKHSLDHGKTWLPCGVLE